MPREMSGIETGIGKRPKGLEAEFHLVSKLPSEAKIDEVSKNLSESVPKTTAEALAHQFFPTEGDLETSNRRAALGALIEESNVSSEVMVSLPKQISPEFRQAMMQIVDEYLKAWRSVSNSKEKQIESVRAAFVELVHSKLS